MDDLMQMYGQIYNSESVLQNLHISSVYFQLLPASPKVLVWSWNASGTQVNPWLM